MQAAIADLVQPVLDAGISLRDRLEAGDPLEWVRERAVLIQVLAALESEGSAAAMEGPEEIPPDFSAPEDPVERRRLSRTTIRYALTCWLDEFLGWHSTWGPRWRQEPLEAELYGAPHSSTKFWDEARYAQTRGDTDAVSVMYWCAMLGFRGAWRDKPEQFEAWVLRVRAFLQQKARTWTMPAGLAPEADVPLYTEAPYRTTMFSVLLAFGLTAPLALMLVWRFI